ncbi:hypothetical protein [Mammaliicoccus sciuri]|uniref:hypothetical protein n=1 Tax=Mammaliicoccus sciuri TaxID=1296 RepID=UPI0034DDC09B
MKKVRLIKITLLIIILAEEIKSVKNETKNYKSIKASDIGKKQNELNQFKYN